MDVREPATSPIPAMPDPQRMEAEARAVEARILAEHAAFVAAIVRRGVDELKREHPDVLVAMTDRAAATDTL